MTVFRSRGGGIALSWLQYARTLRYLRPVQMYGLARNRLLRHLPAGPTAIVSTCVARSTTLVHWSMLVHDVCARSRGSVGGAELGGPRPRALRAQLSTVRPNCLK